MVLKKTKMCSIILATISIIQLTCVAIIVRANLDVLKIPPSGLGANGKQINVTTLLEWPDTESFLKNYAKPAATPFVIQNAAKDWPASRKWTDEYFLNIREGSDEKVTVEQAKKENREYPAEEHTFHEFVRQYQSKDWYMVESVPTFLRQDIIMPPPFRCPQMANLLLEQMMWFSSGGTKSVLHFDHMDNIHCLIAGRKLFILIDPKNKVQIDHPEGSYSSVDVDNVDYSQHPDLVNLDYHLAYLSAGDCLYLPYHWYHQVRGADRNIGVNIWWDHFSMMTLEGNQCKDLPQHQHRTMDQFQFQGTAKLLENVEVVKSHFLLLAGQGGKPLTLSTLLFMFLGDEQHRFSLKDEEVSLKALFQTVFTTLDLNQDGKVVPEEVKTVSKEKWMIIQAGMQSIQQTLEQVQPDMFGDEDNFDDVEDQPAEWEDPQYDTYDDVLFHDQDIDYADYDIKDEL